MTYNEFLNGFLKEFNNIKSFNKKINFANQNLTKIGNGSGRIVYDIDGTKVFKLAKNPKGIAQNAEETRIGSDYDHIVTKIFDWGDDDSWIITEKAKKVNENRIKELTGIPSLNDLFHYLKNYESDINGRGTIFDINPEVQDALDNNEFAHDLSSFIADYSQSAADMGKLSTYGEVDHDGQPSIVLTDYGLSDEVLNTYYSSNRKKRQSIFELYGFADGNDDILSDIGNTYEVRRDMWGLMPYSVSDGTGVINEDFVSLVSKIDKYPDNLLPSTPILIDGFHDCLNNINEILDKVPNKKKFYNNLLALQEYLIRQKFFYSDPLEKEELELNEDAPVVQAMSLNKEDSDEIANEFAEKLNLGHIEAIKGGSYGFAYIINGNKILKITTDASEVDSSLKIQRAKPKTLVSVYSIYKIIDNEKNIAVYALIEDYIINKPVKEFNNYIKIIDTLADSPDVDYVGILRSMSRNKYSYNELVNIIQYILTNKPEANISQEDRQSAYKLMIGLFDIKRDLDQLAIKSNDFSNPENLGYKNGILTFFDIGGYKVSEPKIPEENNIVLEESTTIDESIDRNTADDIANKVVELYKLNSPKYIDGGTYGYAYDIGDNKVLKVTSDRSEGIENLNLIGKPLKYIAQPYQVFSLKSKNIEIASKIYVIILEKLKIHPEYFGRMMKRLTFAFLKILNINIIDAIAIFIENRDEDDVNKIKKYLSKNVEDAKFFYGLINIAKEVHKYGIGSQDYLNPDNLGYKKDGNLGFFDIGFGNYFAKSQNKPEEIEMDEDGSSKFSTDNSIGRDDFPTYNNNDTSALTDNNVPTSTYTNIPSNSNGINERILSSMKGSSTIDVKKHCRLAGLGNTSTACNQGDMKNFNVKPLDENDIKPRFSDAFMRWFSGSKVVDDQGNPLLVYHGTNKEFKKLDYRYGAQPIIWFSSDKDKIMRGEAGAAGTSRIIPAYLSIKKMAGWDEYEKYGLGQLDEMGFDGAKLDDDYFVFNNNQIKIVKNQLSEEINMNEANIMSLKDLPFKKEIEKLGGKIFSVGGAVRDEFLGKESKDLDILITGIPMDKLENILSRYGRVDAVGKSFGILKFKPEGSSEDIDVAIPRTEKSSGDGGHKGFEISSDHQLPIEQDLMRRDFTINAIAKDINGNIIDPYNGRTDLKNKVIRAVNPQAFSDDPLRMLRAIGFASRFNFTIEPLTMDMIQENANRIKEIPPERILTELDKIVKKGNILTGVKLLHNSGLFKEIFGENRGINVAFPWKNIKTMGEFIYSLSVGTVENPAEFFKNNLKGDIDNYKEIKVIELAYQSNDLSPIAARSIAHNMYLISPKSLESKIIPTAIQKAGEELLSGKYPKTVGELAVNGNDLMSLGLKGKEIGEAQKNMLLKIYSDKIKNDKEDLTSIAQNKTNLSENNEGKRIEFGCLMLYLDVPIWSKITSVIKPEDIYDKEGYGIEKEPHLTILYGFHDEVNSDDVFSLFKENMPLKPINVNIKGISVFENEEFDVVKFDVNSEVLTKLNAIMKQLPNTSTFPDYHPHITIAYVKKGEGRKYIRPFEKERKLVGNELVYNWKGHKGKEGGDILMLDDKNVSESLQPTGDFVYKNLDLVAIKDIINKIKNLLDKIKNKEYLSGEDFDNAYAYYKILLYNRNNFYEIIGNENTNNYDHLLYTLLKTNKKLNEDVDGSPEKQEKNDVEYTDKTVMQNEHCGNCGWFNENKCGMIKGIIDSNGWCRLWGTKKFCNENF